jgi:putative ABC transport system permease protein
MLNSYLKTAIRRLMRHPVYSMINIVGLSIGMSCFILIALIVRGEFQVDRFHERADRIFRVTRLDQLSGTANRVALTQAPLAAALKREFPEVEKAACFNYSGNVLVRYRDTKITQGLISFAEPDFFEIFSYTFLSGDPASALRNPQTAVITDQVAEKLFGSEDPLGKVLQMRGMPDVTVTAVIKDHKDSHLHFSIILPFSLYREIGVDIDTWNRYNYTTYVQLQENADAVAFAEKLKGALPRLSASETEYELEIQPLPRIYLYSNYSYDVHTMVGNISLVYVLGIVAFLILLIACINFMNLTTARSTRRAREVGLRKVVGAVRWQLVRQFLGESLFFTGISLFVAVAIIEGVLPIINRVQPLKQYSLFESKNLILYFGLILVAFITGIISGSYPALFLSRFQPVKVLKGVVGQESSRGTLRKILVVGQFFFSIILLFATLTIIKQSNFMQNKDLGYDKSNILVCNLPQTLRDDLEPLKADLLRLPDILQVTACQNLPTWQGPSYSLDDWDGRDSDQMIIMYHASVDYDFFETFGLTIVQGRKFSREFATDRDRALIVNEEAVKAMGMSDPVGKHMGYIGGPGTIIGVVKDYHFATLHDRIGPLVLALEPQNTSYVLLKVNPAALPALTGKIEQVWNSRDPDDTFEITSLDAVLNQAYVREGSLSRFFSYAAYLSLFISCMGLFGLSAQAAEQRFKEVGIRKVIGATELNIFKLLSREHLKLVAVAVVFAWPAGYFTMHLFLQNYPYRTSIGIEIFIFSALLAFIIAFLTVFSQSLKASLIDPVGAIKYE